MRRDLRARRVILISGVSQAEKASLSKIIKQLGGEYLESDEFKPHCTHIVCGKLTRSEKFLGGCATGKWIVTPKYVLESNKARVWLDEASFEWGRHLPAALQTAAADRAMLDAPRRWRLSIDLADGGAFASWRAAVFVDNYKKKVVYKRLLELGGASVISITLPISSPQEVAAQVTHVFSDRHNAAATQCLQNTGILWLPPEYIGEYLCKNPPPDPVVFGAGLVSQAAGKPQSPNNSRMSITSSQVAPSSGTRNTLRTAPSSRKTSTPLSAPNSGKTSTPLSTPSRGKTSTPLSTPILYSSPSSRQTTLGFVKKCSVRVEKAALAPSSGKSSTPPSTPILYSSPPSRQSTLGFVKDCSVIVKKVTLAPPSSSQTSLSQRGRRTRSSAAGTNRPPGSGTRCGGPNPKVSQERTLNKTSGAPVQRNLRTRPVDENDDDFEPHNSTIGGPRERLFAHEMLDKKKIVSEEMKHRIRSSVRQQLKQRNSEAMDTSPSAVINGKNASDSNVPKRIGGSFTPVVVLHDLQMEDVQNEAPLSSSSDEKRNSEESDPLMDISEKASSQGRGHVNGMFVQKEVIEKGVNLKRVGKKRSSPKRLGSATPQKLRNGSSPCTTRNTRGTSQRNQTKTSPRGQSLISSFLVKPEQVLLTLEKARSASKTTSPVTPDKTPNASSLADIERTAAVPMETEIITCGVKRKVLQDDGEKEEVTRETKKQKVLHNGLPWIPFNLENSQGYLDINTNSKAPVKVAFPQAGKYAGIFEACQEEDQSVFAVDFLNSMTNSASYPLPKTLHMLMTDVLQCATSDVLAERAYSALRRILSLHPPQTAALQSNYLTAMHVGGATEASEKGEKWNFLKGVIRDCLDFDQTKESQVRSANSVLLLRYLVCLFEQDFQDFQHRLQQSKKHVRPSMLAQILWPSGLHGYMNQATRELFSLLASCLAIEDKTRQVELLHLVRNLVAIVAECCHLVETRDTISTPADSSHTTISQRAGLLSGELAHKAACECEDERTLGLFLSMLQPAWLKMKVCATLLELYDESLLPPDYNNDNSKLTLHKIVSKYFYLLPKLSSSSRGSPHEKTAFTTVARTPQKPSRALQTLADSNHTKAFDGGQKQQRTSGRNRQQTVEVSSSGQRVRVNVNKRNMKGETPLHVACIKNNVAKVKELLSVPGIDVNMADYAGWTPLHEACNHGHTECVMELLKFKPAKTINTYFKKGEDRDGKLNLLGSTPEGVTALHDAVFSNHTQVVRLLLQYGGGALLLAKTVSGETPMDLVQSEEMREILNSYQSLPPVTPTKRRYSTILTISSQSSADDSQRSFVDPDAESYLPAEEMYQEVFSSGPNLKFTTQEECGKFVLLVFHVVQAYFQVHDLVQRKQERGRADPMEALEAGDLQIAETFSHHLCGFQAHLKKIVFNGKIDAYKTKLLALRILGM